MAAGHWGDDPLGNAKIETTPFLRAGRSTYAQRAVSDIGGIIMQTFSRRLVGRTAVGAVLALCLAVPAVAQGAGGLDPAALDVAGVGLGMTPNDAISALKRFDPKYAITKRYYAGPRFTFANADAQDIKQISTSDQRFAYLYNLSAVKSEQKKQCDYVGTDLDTGKVLGNGGYDCHMKPHAIETVIVWLSPVPGQERVIAVQRKAPFETKPLPAIVSLKQSIFAKYPKDQVTYENQDASGYSVDWIFDPQKRIMSASSAKGRRYYPAKGEVPQQAHGGDGIGLSVMFGALNQNAGLADSMSITLYDGNGLYR